MEQAKKKRIGNYSNVYRINKPLDNLSFADTLKLEKYMGLLAFIVTEIVYSILKRTEEYFKYFLLNAVYRTNPVTMRKIEMILEARKMFVFHCERIPCKKRADRR